MRRDHVVPRAAALANASAAADRTDVAALHGKADNSKRCKQQDCVREGCDSNPRAADCCSEHMFRALVTTIDWLDAHNITYALTGGTLLGAVRNQSMIAWTSDVDIIVTGEDGSIALQQQHDLPFHFFFMYGHVRGCPYDPAGKRRQFSFRPSSPARDQGKTLWFMDIYDPSYVLKKMNRGHVCVNASEGKKVTINGKRFSGPNDPKGCAERMYGSDYMTPKPGIHSCDRVAFMKTDA